MTLWIGWFVLILLYAVVIMIFSAWPLWATRNTLLHDIAIIIAMCVNGNTQFLKFSRSESLESDVYVCVYVYMHMYVCMYAGHAVLQW